VYVYVYVFGCVSRFALACVRERVTVTVRVC